MRLMWCVFLLSVLASPATSGHPHAERQIVLLRGTLTKIDAVHRTVELDTVDPSTKQARNILLFLDKKARLRRGKVRIDLRDLKAG